MSVSVKGCVSFQLTTRNESTRSSRVRCREMAMSVLFVVSGVCLLAAAILLAFFWWSLIIKVKAAAEASHSMHSYLKTATRSKNNPYRIVKSLVFWRFIPKKNLIRENEDSIYLSGLACRAAANEQQLFFGDYWNRVVRSFDMRSDTLRDSDMHKSENIQDVAYSSELDLLFFAELEYTYNNTIPRVVIRSFARSEFGSRNRTERHRIENWQDGNGLTRLRVLSDGTVFFGQCFSAIVRMCRVQTNGSMTNCDKITLPTKFYDFDVVDNEIRLAATPPLNGSVVLYRVQIPHSGELHAKIVSEVPHANASSPLFVGDTLLLRYKSISKVAAFSTAGGKLQSKSISIEPENDEPDENILIYNWCFMNETLVAIGYSGYSERMFLYNATFATTSRQT